MKLTIKKVKKIKKEQKYGLDLDILTELGLQDMIDSEEEESKFENITYEDIRSQFTTPSYVSLPNKLRNDCKHYQEWWDFRNLISFHEIF